MLAGLGLSTAILSNIGLALQVFGTLYTVSQQVSMKRQQARINEENVQAEQERLSELASDRERDLRRQRANQIAKSASQGFNPFYGTSQDLVDEIETIGSIDLLRLRQQSQARQRDFSQKASIQQSEANAAIFGGIGEIGKTLVSDRFLNNFNQTPSSDASFMNMFK